MVIHGTDDEVIDLSHGIAIHDKCQKAVDPLWVEGAGHNDIEIYSQYVERLKRFINDEIRTYQNSIMTVIAQQNKTPDNVAINATTVQPKVQIANNTSTMNVSSTSSSSTSSSASSQTASPPSTPNTKISQNTEHTTDEITK